MNRVTGLIGIDCLFADIHPRILIKFSSAPWPAPHSWFITVPVIRQHREKNHFIIPLPCSLAIPPLWLFRHSPDEIGVGLFLSGACFTSSLLMSRPINLCQSPRVARSPRVFALLGTLSLSLCPSSPHSPRLHLVLSSSTWLTPLTFHCFLPSHLPLTFSALFHVGPALAGSHLDFTWIWVQWFLCFYRSSHSPSLGSVKDAEAEVFWCAAGKPFPSLLLTPPPVHPFSLTTEDFVASSKRALTKKNGDIFSQQLTSFLLSSSITPLMLWHLARPSW